MGYSIQVVWDVNQKKNIYIIYDWILLLKVQFPKNQRPLLFTKSSGSYRVILFTIFRNIPASLWSAILSEDLNGKYQPMTRCEPTDSVNNYDTSRESLRIKKYNCDAPVLSVNISAPHKGPSLDYKLRARTVLAKDLWRPRPCFP